MADLGDNWRTNATWIQRWLEEEEEEEEEEEVMPDKWPTAVDSQ